MKTRTGLDLWPSVLLAPLVAASGKWKIIFDRGCPICEACAAKAASPPQ